MRLFHFVGTRGSAVALGLVLLAVVVMLRPAPPLNLIVVTLDTTRADRISAYGDARAAATPALDRLAREGALFEDATSPVPLTLPAHCTLFTGRLPPAHRVRDNADQLGLATPTLASTLHARGYRTGAFLGSLVLARSHGLYLGFENYDDHIPWGGPSSPRPRRRADVVVDRALGWLDTVKGSPFFVWLHFYDAHLPYDAMPPFDRAYSGRPYEGAVASVDAQIGRLRAFLDQHNLTRHTVIVVIGDHGEGLGDHGELTHGLFVYQSVLRVPFIIRVPKMAPAGQRIRTAVSSADLTPTVLDLLGVDPPGDLDGRSLRPLLRRPGRETAADVYAENLYLQRRFKWSEMQAIRSGSLKLIDKARPELYDLDRDPGESHDLSSERPDVVARLARRLRTWQDRLSAGAPPEKAPSGQVAADIRAQLLALGYVSDAAVTNGRADPVSGADPRDRVALFNRMMTSETGPLLADDEANVRPATATGMAAEQRRSGP